MNNYVLRGERRTTSSYNLSVTRYKAMHARFCEGAERVGGMRTRVMQWLPMQRPVLSWRKPLIVLKSVESAHILFAVYNDRLRTAIVKNACLQNAPGGVDAFFDTRNARNFHATKAVPGKVDVKANQIIISLRAIMREQMTRYHLSVPRFPLADYAHVMGKFLVVGRITIQNIEDTVRSGLDKPQTHIVAKPQIPRNIERQIRVGLELALQSSHRAQACNSFTINRPFNARLERLFWC